MKKCSYKFHKTHKKTSVSESLSLQARLLLLLLKKRLRHSSFPVNFTKFLRTPFSYRTPRMATSKYQLRLDSLNADVMSQLDIASKVDYLNQISYTNFIVSHRKTSNTDVSPLNFIYNCHFCFI